MNETKEGTEQFVAVEAPLQIGPEQNFYDQPPFNLILAHRGLATSLSSEQTKALLAVIAKYSQKLPLQDELDRENGSGAFFAEKAMAELGHDINPGNVKVDGKKIPAREGIKTAASLIRDLAPYPYWFEYVTTYADSKFFRDGRWKEQGIPIPIDSYPIYAKKRLERNKVSLVGIEEIFPQQFSSHSTSIIVSPELVHKGVTSLGVLKKGK